MSKDLKPCPFCGNEPVIRRFVEEYDADADSPAGEYDARFDICCDECGISQSEEYRSEAITAWNRRSENHVTTLINFTVSTTKTDGRTWLHLKRSDGASAALSCQTSHDSGETIASQVVTEFAEAVSKSANALEGGVTVTDEMIEKAHDAFHAFPRPGYWKDKMRATLQAALSAPAQSVEEGTRDTADAIVDALFVDLRDRRFLKWLFSKRPTFIANFEDGSPLESLDEDVQREIHETWKGIIASALAASPAPAPHAGVDTDVPDYDAGLLNDFGGGDVSWWQDYLRAEIERANQHWRAALGDRT